MLVSGSVGDRRGFRNFAESLGVERGAANQGSVDVRAGEQARRVVCLDAPAVQDAGDLGEALGLVFFRRSRIAAWTS